MIDLYNLSVFCAMNELLSFIRATKSQQIVCRLIASFYKELFNFLRKDPEIGVVLSKNLTVDRRSAARSDSGGRSQVRIPPRGNLAFK